MSLTGHRVPIITITTFCFPFDQVKNIFLILFCLHCLHLIPQCLWWAVPFIVFISYSTTRMHEQTHTVMQVMLFVHAAEVFKAFSCNSLILRIQLFTIIKLIFLSPTVTPIHCLPFPQIYAYNYSECALDYKCIHNTQVQYCSSVLSRPSVNINGVLQLCCWHDAFAKKRRSRSKCWLEVLCHPEKYLQYLIAWWHFHYMLTCRDGNNLICCIC